jgi:hypothetical protein
MLDLISAAYSVPVERISGGPAWCRRIDSRSVPLIP